MDDTMFSDLESESIEIIREVAATAKKAVMLYSIGKDSSVMLRLAQKAFFPGPIPFPLMHIDTGWKFREMIAFRDRTAREAGFELITYTNQRGVAEGVGPITHGSALYTDIMKTEALKQALTRHGFDAAFGGARRDEEKSRAKERVFSFRSAQQRWDPKAQRPELWSLYNTRLGAGESLRVFPLSNWTELDVWRFIAECGVDVPSLYYAHPRQVFRRDGMLMAVNRYVRRRDDEVPFEATVRFRTLGCYPLTGAIDSDADTLEKVIAEMLVARSSERQGRVIDRDAGASMERKKSEGYF